MKSITTNFTKGLLLALLSFNYIFSQEYKVLESDANHILLEFNFEGKFDVKDLTVDGIKLTKIIDKHYPIQMPGDPYLPTRFYEIGIPQNTNAVLSILGVESEVYKDKFVAAAPDSANQPMSKLNYNHQVYGNNRLFPEESAEIKSEVIFRFLKTASLYISPFQFNPVERTLILNKKIIARIDFKENPEFQGEITTISDQMTEEIIEGNVINPIESLTFLGKIKSISDKPIEDYWYNPNKNYFKFFLNKKGVYRITYEYLLSLGISSSSGLQDGKIEIFNNGISIPVDVIDKQQDGKFNEGDYFQFIGQSMLPSPNASKNIYNKNNVYWFSYQAESVNQYKSINGYPSQTYPKIITNQNTVHYEEDVMYERLGYANDDNRDYWFWDKAEARGGIETTTFTKQIGHLDSEINPEKPEATVRVNVHGINIVSCSPGHSAYVGFNGKVISKFNFNGETQQSFTFEKDFLLGFGSSVSDSIPYRWGFNYFNVGVDGKTCNSAGDDIIRINWIEFDYWRYNRINAKNYIFQSLPDQLGASTYYLWQWLSDNMKIYIPQRAELIKNPLITNDPDKGVYFADTVAERTEYYLVSNDSYLLPDSAQKNINSDLRNLQNAADYIIITHPLFKEAADRLAEFRSNNIKGISNPRVKVVDVFDIYNEFSAGLLDPLALQYFVKYAFENWQSPAPQYVTLMGDMSYDYRKINPSSKENYIPSIPFHALPYYGQAASDNSIVTVAGNDLVPELAIGRISCEDINEANLLVDKIINYPAETSKEWKQNVLLLSSGLDKQDENKHAFNDSNMVLANSFLHPNGINSSKVFRYANKDEYIPFQGEGPKIREEINKGAVIVNYYGHGGGLQWDLVFTNDDILALENGNKLPFVISVTCYTAHFDNQEIFGEIFNSIPGKGSIAFFGSSGVTLWPATAGFNDIIFKDIFNQKVHTIGKSILKAKSVSSFGPMLAVQTLLGDPALELAIPYFPDFVIKSSDIKPETDNPVAKDTIIVTVDISNPGRSFPLDTVTVELYENIISDTTLIGKQLLREFGETKSVTFSWIPKLLGLTNLIARINEVDTLYEEDHSDNIAVTNIAVYSFGEPNVLKPINNSFTSGNKVDFVFVDIGHYINQQFKYRIEIDTSRNLDSPSKITSPVLSPVNGLVNWSSPQLAQDVYYWKAYIISTKETNSTGLNTFSITNESGSGFLARSTQLKDFTTSNIIFSDLYDALILNTQLLTPRPSQEKLLESIFIDRTQDATKLTTITTDGSYMYFGDLAFYRQGAKSNIYKIGTGLNGTTKGFNYGKLPIAPVHIKNQIFYHKDGFLYVATGDDSTLLRVNINSGDTSRVHIPSKLLPSEDGLLKNGGFYLTSDGKYVYNISPGHGNYRNRHVVRVLDPANGWNKAKEDIVLLGESEPGFTNYYVANDYLTTNESFNSGYFRRYRLADGFYEEEYLPFIGRLDMYSWTYDWVNDYLYTGLFLPGNSFHPFGFLRFVGTYKAGEGTINTSAIGPANNWNDMSYTIDNSNLNSSFKLNLFGSKDKQNWKSLINNVSANQDLGGINAKENPYIKLSATLSDSSVGNTEPLKLKSLKVNYNYLSEINFKQDFIKFSDDSLMQGLPVELSAVVSNIGYSDLDSLKLEFYLNSADTTFYTTYVNLKKDSSATIKRTIKTDNLLYTAPVSPSNISVVASSKTDEYFSFNNIGRGTFYVVRDSAKPEFSVMFDGQEIVDGDIVSSQPEIVITLEDNSPLPLTPTHFTVGHIFNNVYKKIIIPSKDVSFDYTPYPNSRAVIAWKPTLDDGQHILSVYAKDSSGNYFDSTTYTYKFNVFNDPDLVDVYNYPNPFTDNTLFTFELRGNTPPEEFKFKIFTIAGRLIKEINVPQSSLKIGFNKIFWDGKDEDGDEIANGIYFYKVITKQNGEMKTLTRKLAKAK